MIKPLLFCMFMTTTFFGVQAALSPDILSKINLSYTELDKEKQNIVQNGTLDALQDFLSAQQLIKSIGLLKSDGDLETIITSTKQLLASGQKSCVYQEKVLKIIAGEQYGSDIACEHKPICKDKIGDKFRKMDYIRQINDFIFIQRSKAVVLHSSVRPSVVAPPKIIAHTVKTTPPITPHLNIDEKRPISPRPFISPIKIENIAEKTSVQNQNLASSPRSVINNAEKNAVSPRSPIVPANKVVLNISNNKNLPVTQDIIPEKATPKINEDTPTIVQHEKIILEPSAHVVKENVHQKIDELSLNWEGADSNEVTGSKSGVSGVIFLKDKKNNQIVIKSQNRSLNQALATFMLKNFGLNTVDTYWVHAKSDYAKRMHNAVISARKKPNGNEGINNASNKGPTTNDRIANFSKKYTLLDTSANTHEGFLIMKMSNLSEIGATTALTDKQVKDIGKLFVSDLIMSNLDRFFTVRINNINLNTNTRDIMALDQEMFNNRNFLNSYFDQINSFSKIQSVSSKKQSFKNGIFEMRDFLTNIDIDSYVDQKINEFKNENNLNNMASPEDDMAVSTELDRLKTLWKNNMAEVRRRLQTFH